MVGWIVAQNHGLLHGMVDISFSGNGPAGLFDIRVKVTRKTQIRSCDIFCELFLGKPADVFDIVRQRAEALQASAFDRTDKIKE